MAYKKPMEIFQALKKRSFPAFTRGTLPGPVSLVLDVIFTNTHGGFFARLIRFRGRLEGEKAKCNHTELYTSNGRALSANRSGV